MRKNAFNRVGLLAAVLAWTQVSSANIVGNDFQNFNPTYNGLDFITVHSSQTLAPCILNTGVFYNQAYNSLPFYESVDFDISEFRNRSTYSDAIGGFDFNVGYGISENWDVGANIQSIVYQQVESDSLVSGSFSQQGLSEIRLNTKYRLGGDELGGMAVVGSVNFNTVENNVFLGADAGPTVNLEFVVDKAIGRTNWAANFGYRLRQPGTQIQAGVPPMTNAFIYSTAASFLFTTLDTKLVWELFGSYPTEDSGDVSAQSRSNLETLLGLKHDATRSLALLTGFGTEVLHGTATPDWRFFVGLNFALDCCGANEEVKPVPKLAKEPVEAFYENNVWEEPEPLPAEEEDLDPLGIETGLPPPVVETYEAPANEPMVQEQIEPLPAPDQVFSVDTIHFKHDSHTSIYGSGISYLQELADAIKSKGYKRVIVVGHTDSVGSNEYNMQLSRRRASTVANHLINQGGLDRDKVRIRYFGESRPIADNGNFQGRKKNRRVEFEVYY